MSDNRPDPAIQATAQLYHDWLTGLILHLIAHRGTADASRFVRQLFRTKHLEQFLPGLRKLGLDGLPDAVACAQYHYLSNALGGVKVEYHQESDRKAWVRYPPPRWIWQGVAIAGIPTEVSAAMMWGWHAHNGVSLGNPRLGFVCTKQTVDGQPGLEGYYLEGDDELAPEERLRFAPDEEMPRFEPDRAPGTAAAEWPEERLAKAYRNYASDYMATSLGVLEDLFGPQDARDCAGRSARAVAMHWLDGAQEVLGSTGQAPRDFAVFLERIALAHGDSLVWSEEGGLLELEWRGWRWMRHQDPVPSIAFEAWNELWVGALSVFDRFLLWETHAAQLTPEPLFRWRLRRRH